MSGIVREHWVRVLRDIYEDLGLTPVKVSGRTIDLKIECPRCGNASLATVAEEYWSDFLPPGFPPLRCPQCGNLEQLCYHLVDERAA